MSSINTASILVSRPKIHRLPAIGSRKIPKKPVVPGFLVFWGAVFVTLLVLSVIINNYPSAIYSQNILIASVVPKISVSSKDQQPIEETSIVSGTSGILSPSFGDAQAATGLVATGMTTISSTVEKSGKIILLQGKSESIIGQLTKIPVENEQITEIKAVSDIDNGAGRELLSIISKY